MIKFISLCLVLLMLTSCSEMKTYTNKTKETISNYTMSEFDENKSYSWGLKKNKDEPPCVKPYDEIIKNYNAKYIFQNKENKIYLTFDEGYENGYTSKILDVLAQKHVKAIFFITGAYFNSEQDLVKRMVEEGHEVGNHTVNHFDVSSLSVEDLKKEVNELNEDFNSLFGKRMKFMRPPEGKFSRRSLSVVSELGYTTLFWSFAYKDWERNSINGPEYAISQITPYFHNGEIMLLHAVSKDNADSLAQIIDMALERGYVFGCPEELY